MRLRAIREFAISRRVLVHVAGANAAASSSVGSGPRPRGSGLRSSLPPGPQPWPGTEIAFFTGPISMALNSTCAAGGPLAGTGHCVITDADSRRGGPPREGPPAGYRTAIADAQDTLARPSRPPLPAHSSAVRPCPFFPPP